MTEWLEAHLSPCFFQSRFGWQCPGCGMQRAFISLLRGNLSESLHHHPALLPLLLTLILIMAQLRIKHPKGGTAVVLGFIITGSITMIHFLVRQFL